MVRVLQFGMTENIGGTEMYLMAQYRQMDKKKVLYDFVFMPLHENNQMAFADEVQAEGSRIYRVLPPKRALLMHYFLIMRLMWQHRHEYQAVVMNVNSVAYIFPLLAAAVCGIPCRIMHSHNSGEIDAHSFIRKFIREQRSRINRWLMRHVATQYWACSGLAGRWMFRGEPFTVIHNAIDLERFHYQPDLRDRMRRELGVQDRFVLGNVARFSYQKNQPFLVDVFKEVKARIPEAILLLVGNATYGVDVYDETKRKVVQYGLQDSVKFLGMRSDTNALYQAFDVFVLPSRFEGLCIASIEAQGAGLVNICSKVLPPETNVSRDFYTMDLNDGAVKWAETIIAHRHDVRHDGAPSLRAAGYDICKEAKRVEHFFASLAQ